MTDDLEKEAPLNAVLVHDRPGRRFASVEGSRWGELILPAPGEAAPHGDAGLKLLAVSAYTYSLPLLAAVFDFQRGNPGRLRLIGLATDDPINADAHIDLRKRVWKYYSQDERVAMETLTVEAALAEGVPVFTGELKSPGFRALIADWAPDAIVVCVCGQIFDAAIIEAARCGVYNFHPTDLAKGIGAGPTPYEEVVGRGDPWSRWTVHRMTVDVDSGRSSASPRRCGSATRRARSPLTRAASTTAWGCRSARWSEHWSPNWSGATAPYLSSTSRRRWAATCGLPSRHRSTDPAGARSHSIDRVHAGAIWQKAPHT